MKGRDMNKQVIEAMRYVTNYWNEDGVDCEYCGTNSGEHHNATCPIGTLTAHLAKLDAPKGETETIQIPVVMGADKKWLVRGDSFDTVADNAAYVEEVAEDYLFCHCQTFIVEALIPIPQIPEPQTIEGTVCDRVCSIALEA